MKSKQQVAAIIAALKELYPDALTPPPQREAGDNGLPHQ